VRIDKEKVERFSDEITSGMAAYVESVIKDIDAVIIEDYGKGVITPAILAKIVPLAKRYNKVISVDPKEEHFSYYRGISVITPNNHEASRAVGFQITDEATLLKAGRKLLDKLNCKIVLITLGEHGMAVFQKNKPMRHIPTVAQEVFDVSGAGDTAIATLTAALAAKANPVEAAELANHAAGVVVGKLGTATCTPAELTASFARP
jgi:D-beta-D-heptose 7-phosphate kinase/D-beta-D-heptose 1-phosphate adenosyltransferase